MSLLGSLLGQGSQGTGNTTITNTTSGQTIYPSNIALQNAQAHLQYQAVQSQMAQNQTSAYTYGNNLQGLGMAAQAATPMPSIKDPGFELSLTACADLWETRYGDEWVPTVYIPVDEYKIPFSRMQARGWFETANAAEGQHVRLLPVELRR